MKTDNIHPHGPNWMTLVKKKIRFISISFFLFLLAGCAAPTPRPDSLVNYDLLKSRIDTNLDLAYVADGMSLDEYSVIAVPEVHTEELGIEEDRGREYGEYLRREIIRRLTYSERFEVISDKVETLRYSDEDFTPLKLELAITRVNYGLGLVRYLIGFGMGSTDIQVEGKLTDPKDGKTLIAFADRRQNPGDPNFGFNLKSIDDAHVLKVSLSELAKDVVDLMLNYKQ